MRSSGAPLYLAPLEKTLALKYSKYLSNLTNHDDGQDRGHKKSRDERGTDGKRMDGHICSSVSDF